MTKYFAGFFFLFLFVSTSFCQSTVEEQIIVQLEEGSTYKDLFSFIKKEYSAQLTFVRKLTQDEEIYLLSSDLNRDQLIRQIGQFDLFDQVFPNTQATPRSNPNDPNYNLQWNLAKIGLEDAWEYTTGGQTVQGDEIVVAVLDDGFFTDHEDWGDNLYSNPFDQPGDMNNDGCPGDCGVDDDGDGRIDEDWLGREKGEPGYDPSYNSDDDENGYIDDTQGLHATSGTDNHPSRAHGTSVSSIIGAKSNNSIGISGINWNVKVLPLSSGTSEADVIETYNYIAQMRKRYNETDGEAGAFIVSCNYSLGIDFAIPEDHSVWCDLYDKMGEQGIISTVATSNKNFNVDIEGDIPSLCPSNYLIAVTSTDENDNFAEAAFGKINIDMAAPGEEAYSFRPNDPSGYGSFPGTSAATPHVAGAIGLIYASPCDEFLSYFKNNPSKVDSLASIVINSGDQLPSLVGLTKSEKRLNVFNTMRKLAAFCGGTEGDLSIVNVFPNPVDNELKIEFAADPAEKIYVEIYNILGQRFVEKTMNFPLFEEPLVSVNTSGLITGMYFIVIQQNDKSAAMKFYKR